MSNNFINHSPVVPIEQEYIGQAPGLGREIVGLGFELFAHGISVARAIGGVAIANQIENDENYHSYTKVIAVGALGLLDYIDGKIARAGRKIRHADESMPRPFGAFLDQLMDKVMVDDILLNIGVREIRNSNVIYGTTILSAAGVTIARDIDTTAERLVAIKEGIDIRSEQSGKVKATKQYGWLMLAVSPVAKRKSVQAIVGLGLLHSSYESVKSGLSLRERFRNIRKEYKEKKRLAA